ncbi:hypothetical protein SRHO_G00269720 [Serrasalmus rhombeus]
MRWKSWYLEHLRCYEVCRNHSAKLLRFCCIEIPVYKMLLRIILSKDDIRKIHTDSEPETLDSFHSFLKCKLGLHGDFVVQFQDPDFGNEFCNLTSLSELPKEKATLKVILKQTPESPRTDSTLDTASLSSLSSSSLEDTPTCRRLWPDPFVIPKFSYDVELKLKRDIPEGKTQNVLEEERAAIVAEMKKKRVDWKKVTDMMASTFSLRPKEIVEQQPLVAEVKAKWPALFTDKQIEAEFARLTSTDLWDTFVSGLDQYLERFLQMYRAKSHCIQTLSSLLSLLDDDNSVQKKRAVILRGLPHFLREDASNLLKTAETTESEEQVAKGVNIGILLIQEEEDVLDFSVVLEEQIVLNGIRDFPHAVAMLVGLLFALNIDYPKELRYTFEVIQKVLLNIGGEQCSARVHGLRNRLLCKTLVVKQSVDMLCVLCILKNTCAKLSIIFLQKY